MSWSQIKKLLETNCSVNYAIVGDYCKHRGKKVLGKWLEVAKYRDRKYFPEILQGKYTQHVSVSPMMQELFDLEKINWRLFIEINENPHRFEPRRIYADWLEEQGDPVVGKWRELIKCRFSPDMSKF